MKTGRDLQDVCTQIMQEQERKRDFVASTSSLKMNPHLGMEISMIRGGVPIDILEFPKATRHAHSQIAARLNIPAKFYKMLLNSKDGQLHRLLSQNVNGLLEYKPEKRLIRTMTDKDGNNAYIRAYLSDRYRIMDNLDIATTVLPIIQESGCKVVSSEITESKFYIKAISESVQGDLSVGDPVQGGVVVSNSEIGDGSFNVQPLIYRLVCTNGMIASDYSMKKYHTGARVGGNEEALEIFSNRTLELDDAAFIAKIRDTTRAALKQTSFDVILQSMKATKDQPITKVPDTMELTRRNLRLSEDEGNAVMKHLIEGGDLSGFGLLNAITRSAQDIESYDRATEMEKNGGLLLNPKFLKSICV